MNKENTSAKKNGLYATTHGPPVAATIDETDEGEDEKQNSEELYNEREFLPLAHGPYDLRQLHRTNMATVE